MVSRSGPVFAAKQCDNARRMNQNQRYEVLMHFPGYECLMAFPGVSTRKIARRRTAPQIQS